MAKPDSLGMSNSFSVSHINVLCPQPRAQAFNLAVTISRLSNLPPNAQSIVTTPQVLHLILDPQLEVTCLLPPYSTPTPTPTPMPTPTPTPSPTHRYENRSHSICFLIAGFCTFTATTLPVSPSPPFRGLSTALCTWAIEAEARGSYEKDSKRWWGLSPRSWRNTFCDGISSFVLPPSQRWYVVRGWAWRTYPFDLFIVHRGGAIEDMLKGLSIGFGQQRSLESW